ncbi:ABC transporter permease [Glycomyces xiaoerkulensis]|uniref:ABC transporter permease n=1 Tax=Glycomyces xiaoerkulensis TaxID=2038139 RepID=UPI000C26463E|nr:ABC transporter permease subunit [Glycomyces xiaoerkulensis]
MANTTSPRVASPAPAGAGVRRVYRKRKFSHRFRQDWPLLAMTLPAVVQLSLFFYYPSLYNVIAFMDYSPFRSVWDNPIVGFTWFQMLFADDQFWLALGNTLKFATAQLLFVFPLSITLALLMHGMVSSRLRYTFQSIVYLPYFFSWVLVVVIFTQVLGPNGLFSQWALSLGADRLDITRSADSFLFLAWMQWTWKDAGWGMIIFLAALASINPNLYEAAAVDGASRARRLWHITLPGIRPVIVLLVILQLGQILSVGFEQYLVQRTQVGWSSTEVLDTFVYFKTFGPGALSESYGTAAGLFKGVIGLILILVANNVAHRLGEQGIYRKS